jgi:nitrate reductase NapE component
MRIPPSQQLDELKTFIFMYIVMAPLLSALFADKIDNKFVVCLLFVALVGTAVIHVKNKLDILEESLKEQEKRLAEVEGTDEEESES